MEKIVLRDELREDYRKLIQTAQNIENSLGSAYYKMAKMVSVREQVDADLKTWWEKVSEEYKIDKTKDYFVDQEGAINVVERPETPEAPKPEAPAKEEEPKEEAPKEEPVEDVDSKKDETVKDLE